MDALEITTHVDPGDVKTALTAVRVSGRRRELTTLLYDPAGKHLAISKRRFASTLAVEAKPRSTGSFDEIAEHLMRLTGPETNWSIWAGFEFSDRVRSLVELPTKVSSGDMTEIQGFRFGKPDRPESVIVEVVRGSLHHQTYFERVGPLTSRSIRTWVQEATEMSGRFIETLGS
jgi:hypothetical protein